MEEKKKNTGSIIFIILLIIVILGLVGYICYDKGVFNKKEVTREKTSNVEKISFKEAGELINQYNINYISIKDYKKSGHYFEYLVSTLDSKEEYSCDQLKKKDNKKWFEDENIIQSEDGYVCFTKEKHPVYSYDDINKKYKEVYNKELKKESFSLNDLGRCNLDTYYYIKDVDGFIKINIVGGCITGPYDPIDINVISDAKIENNILTITAYVEHFERDDLSVTQNGFKINDEKVECELYNENNQEAADFQMNVQYNTEIIRDKILAEYLDKIDKYNITFKVDGDKYILDTIKKVND